LTGLPNRRLLLDRLQQAMAASKRSGQIGALMFIDLDNFKNINDLHGHQTGDQMLCLTAERLSHEVRASDTVARLGGDEFVVMLGRLGVDPEHAASQAEHVGMKLLASLDKPYRLGELGLHSSASIGVVLFGEDDSSREELMKRADMSMYEAKVSGKNALRFFDPHMQQAVQERLRLEEQIREGLRAGEFVLHFQPQLEQAGGVVGAEALVRWRHPERGLLAPDAFISQAERAGLIQELDIVVLKQACEQLARWARMPHFADLTLAAPQVGIEAVLARDPEVILAGSGAQLDEWQAWPQLDAVRNGRLLEVPDKGLERPSFQMLGAIRKLCEVMVRAAP
jgi:diguanylate cyclase (GGDEF)-like protein